MIKQDLFGDGSDSDEDENEGTAAPASKRSNENVDNVESGVAQKKRRIEEDDKEEAEAEV